jgi:hypothetical protein
MWRVFKEAGRPMPQFSEDDVIDYMVLEAVAIRVAEETAEAQKKVKRREWRKDTSALDSMR